MEKSIAGGVKELVFQEVEKSPNPDIAKSILYGARNTGCYLDLLPKRYGVSQKEVAEVVRYLENAGLIRVNINRPEHTSDLSTVFLTNGTEDYFKTEIYGLHTLLSKEGLNRDIILKLMDNLSNFVIFYFSKNFEFPLNKLEQLKKQSHKSIKHIETDEEIFFHHELKLPRAYSVSSGFSSFAQEDDPTTLDGGARNNRFEFMGKFNSPQEALSVGFDRAYGRPITSREFNIYGDKTNNLPCAIEIENKNRIYSVSLRNIRYDVIEFELPYQLEAKKVLPQLEAKIKEIIEK